MAAVGCFKYDTLLLPIEAFHSGTPICLLNTVASMLTLIKQVNKKPLTSMYLNWCTFIKLISES